MQYLYHGTLVESSTPLDSAIFIPVEADKPTKPAEPEIAPAQFEEKPRVAARKKKTVRRK